MSYNVANGAILQATIVQRLEGQTVLNILHYVLQGVAGETDGPALIDTLNTAFNAAGGVVGELQNCQSSSLGYDRILYQWITPNRFAYRAYVPFNLTGNIEEAAAPVNVAAAVLRKTDAAGPTERGTLHVAGLPAGQLNGSFIEVGLRDLLLLFGDSTLAEQGPAETRLTPVLFHAANPLVSPEPESCLVQPYTRVMRRRTVGVGI